MHTVNTRFHDVVSLFLFIFFIRVRRENKAKVQYHGWSPEGREPKRPKVENV